jgi:quercetin dioxygenase-like cupin family protein
VLYRLHEERVVERWADGAQPIADQLRRPDPMDARTADVRVTRSATADWRGDVPGARFWSLPLPGLALTCFRLEPGTRFQLHAHASEQITMVLEGELTFTVHETDHVLGPGDAIAVPAWVEHAVIAGREAVLAVDAWSPPPEHLGGS